MIDSGHSRMEKDIIQHLEQQDVQDQNYKELKVLPCESESSFEESLFSGKQHKKKGTKKNKKFVR